MPMLRNPKLEKFSQELALALNEGLSERKAAAIASVKADYPQGTSAAKNAHKRALRVDVKSRVAELRAPGIAKAEAAIGVTTEYLLERLVNLAEFNPDDYLSEPDEKGERYYTLAGVSRSLLSRCAQVKIGRAVMGRGKSRKIVSFVADVLPHDPIQALKLMAQIKGLMAPEKRDLTIHATDQMTDDELARIAAGGSPRDPAAPVNP